YLFFVYDGDLVVGSYFLYRLGIKSWELYGGVTEEGLQKKANYLLKWEAIRSMKLNGVKNYDQWGVAPINTSDDGSNRHDETHALAGVTYFKEGFGGERVAYVGSWDLPRKKLLYSVARLLKKL